MNIYIELHRYALLTLLKLVLLLRSEAWHPNCSSCLWSFSSLTHLLSCRWSCISKSDWVMCLSTWILAMTSSKLQNSVLIHFLSVQAIYNFKSSSLANLNNCLLNSDFNKQAVTFQACTQLCVLQVDSIIQFHISVCRLMSTAPCLSVKAHAAYRPISLKAHGITSCLFVKTHVHSSLFLYKGLCTQLYHCWGDFRDLWKAFQRKAELT